MKIFSRALDLLTKVPPVLGTKMVDESQEGEKTAKKDKKCSNLVPRKRLSRSFVKLRDMETSDIDKIQQIAKLSFRTPYTRLEFLHAVETGKKLFSEKKKKDSRFAFLPTFSLVIEVEGEIAGYVIGQRRYEYRINPGNKKKKKKKKKEIPKREKNISPIEIREDGIGRPKLKLVYNAPKLIYYMHGMNMAISPRFRRLGLSTILIEEAISICQTLNCKWISLNVAVHNKPAQKLYEKFGFKKTATTKMADSKNESKKRERKKMKENEEEDDEEKDPQKQKEPSSSSEKEKEEHEDEGLVLGDPEGAESVRMYLILDENSMTKKREYK